jgi:hypothetical protein
MGKETAAMAVSVPEDVLLEILVRVKDEPTLFRCATASKRWSHLVADPSFLRCRWPDQDYSSSLVGFFAWKLFISMPRSPLGPGLRSFVTATLADLLDRAVPLVSRHGLLLVRLEAHDDVLQLAVCSLLIGTCHMLPSLNFATAINYIDEYEYSGYALLTGADCRTNDESSSPPPVLPSDSSFFKVVMVTSDYYNDLKYSLHMFSSDKARWSGRTNCFGNTSHNMEHYGLFGDAVVCRGMAHWLFRYCADPCLHLIKLNTQTGHISRMKLQFPNDYVFTSHISLTLAANGTLSVLRMEQTGNQLEIWGQQEDQQNVDGTYSEWLCTRMIEKKELGEETQGRKLWVFGEKCGTLLVNDGQHMYTADIKTGMMEEVSIWPYKSFDRLRHFVPLEMDWPMIFITRLSTIF